MEKIRSNKIICNRLAKQKNIIHDSLTVDRLKNEKSKKTLRDEHTVKEMKALSNWLFDFLICFITAIRNKEIEYNTPEGYGFVIRCKPGKIHKDNRQFLELVPDRKIEGFEKFSILLESSTDVVVFLSEYISKNSKLDVSYFKSHANKIEVIYLFVWAKQ